MKTAARRVTLALLSLIASALGAEILVRLVFGSRFAPRPAFTVVDEELIKRLSPDLDHTFHGADFQIHIATDALGNRLGSLGPIDDTDSDLVLLVGDSNIFSWGVSTPDTLASHLDTLLHSATGVRAVNLGVGGYGTLQAAARLQRFLGKIDPARVRAILVLHITNDCTDNEIFLLYQNGYMEFTEKAASSIQGNRSPLHAINLARQIAFSKPANGSPPGTPARNATGDAGFVDVLQTTGMWYSSKKPEPITLPTGFVVDADHEIFDRKLHKGRLRRLYESDVAPSALQSELLQLAVDQIGRAAGGLAIPVIHTAQSPNVRFSSAVEDAVTRTPPRGNRVLFRSLPAGEPPRNPHSGGHYTPEHNRFLAELFLGWLQDQGVAVTASSGR